MPFAEAKISPSLLCFDDSGSGLRIPTRPRLSTTGRLGDHDCLVKSALPLAVGETGDNGLDLEAVAEAAAAAAAAAEGDTGLPLSGDTESDTERLCDSVLVSSGVMTEPAAAAVAAEGGEEAVGEELGGPTFGEVGLLPDADGDLDLDATGAVVVLLVSTLTSRGSFRSIVSNGSCNSRARPSLSTCLRNPSPPASPSSALSALRVCPSSSVSSTSLTKDSTNRPVLSSANLPATSLTAAAPTTFSLLMASKMLALSCARIEFKAPLRLRLSARLETMSNDAMTVKESPGECASISITNSSLPPSTSGQGARESDPVLAQACCCSGARSRAFRRSPPMLLLILSALLSLRASAFVRSPGALARRVAHASAVSEAQQVLIGEVCERAARAAGKIVLQGSSEFDLQRGVIEKAGSRDILTEFDTKSQETIKSIILGAFPQHKFLGEEDVPAGREAAAAAIERVSAVEHLWIVDPIDGTTNFAHGQPLAGIIIAYASQGVVEFGLIYDPFRDECFTAWRGRGAFLNNRPIKCCGTQLLKDAVVATGSPPNLQSLNACLRATNAVSSQVRTVRMLGSAAIMLGWVACGRLSSYFEADMSVWDIAAGALIVTEAGGKVTDVWNGKYTLQTRNFVATNGLVHTQLLSKLIEARFWLE